MTKRFAATTCMIVIFAAIAACGCSKSAPDDHGQSMREKASTREEPVTPKALIGRWDALSMDSQILIGKANGARFRFDQDNTFVYVKTWRGHRQKKHGDWSLGENLGVQTLSVIFKEEERNVQTEFVATIKNSVLSLSSRNDASYWIKVGEGYEDTQKIARLLSVAPSQSVCPQRVFPSADKDDLAGVYHDYSYENGGTDLKRGSRRIMIDSSLKEGSIESDGGEGGTRDAFQIVVRNGPCGTALGIVGEKISQPLSAQWFRVGKKQELLELTPLFANTAPGGAAKRVYLLQSGAALDGAQIAALIRQENSTAADSTKNDEPKSSETVLQPEETTLTRDPAEIREKRQLELYALKNLEKMRTLQQQFKRKNKRCANSIQELSWSAAGGQAQDTTPARFSYHTDQRCAVWAVAREPKAVDHQIIVVAPDGQVDYPDVVPMADNRTEQDKGTQVDIRSLKDTYELQRFSRCRGGIRCWASSILEPEKDFDCCNLFDDNPKSAWCEGSDDDGLEQWVAVETPMAATSLMLTNGYSKSEDLFAANNRVRTMQIHVIDDRDDPVRQMKLVSRMEPQRMILPETGVLRGGDKLGKKIVKLTIKDVYKGLQYRDTCISEIKICSGKDCK